MNVIEATSLGRRFGARGRAPVLARELQTGTFRYAWTQGFERWRRAFAKPVVLAAVVTAATVWIVRRRAA
jgi:hypothetical protein